MKTWDGTSPTRPDILDRKKPDGADWVIMTQQLQATQEFVANLATNADIMPNLVEDIKAKHVKLISIQADINKLTLPEDVKLQVDDLEKGMEKLRSIYQHAAEVLQTVNFLQRQLLNLGRRIDKHTEETDRKNLAFENRVAQWQRANEERWVKRLEKAEDQLGAIALAMGVKSFGE